MRGVRFKVISGQSSDDLEEKINKWMASVETLPGFRLYRWHVTIDGTDSAILYFTAEYDTPEES